MPFQVIKSGNKFQLKNLHTKKVVKTKFNSKESALRQGQNYMRYRGEKSKIVGNKVLPL
jgi:hypothetical protein